MATTNEWSADRLREIRQWKEQNKAKWTETAAHFGVDAKRLMSANNYYKRHPKAGKQKAVKRAQGNKRLDVPATTAPRFVDIQASVPNDDRAVIVVCKVSQIKAVLGGLE